MKISLKVRQLLIQSAVCLFLPCAFALGQAPACSEQTTDAGMRGCEANRYAQASRKLQSTYLLLMKQSSPAGKRRLVLAEQAWQHFATSNAAFVLTQAEGGTLGPLLQTTTLADMTEARTAELEKMLR